DAPPGGSSARGRSPARAPTGRSISSSANPPDLVLPLGNLDPPVHRNLAKRLRRLARRPGDLQHVDDRRRAEPDLLPQRIRPQAPAARHVTADLAAADLQPDPRADRRPVGLRPDEL